MTTPRVNPELLKLAHAAIRRREKVAVQPPGDPAAGMPTDPMAGGMPPGGMDPSMMGGAMPPGGMDPSMMGGGGMPMAPPAAPMPAPMPGQPAPMPGQPAPMPGQPAAGSGKQNKDQMQQGMQMDMWQMKKYLFMLGEALGVPAPPSLMDGPNRDPQTGLPMAPGQPGSTSDPAVMQQEAQQMQQQQGGQGAAQGGPQGGAIPAIQPMEGAGPGMAAGGEKGAATVMGVPYGGGMISTTTGQYVKAGRQIKDKASALARLLTVRK